MKTFILITLIGTGYIAQDLREWFVDLRVTHAARVDSITR